MSAVSILYSPKPTTIGTIEVDATVTQEHTGDAVVTEFPVEVGSDITDSIRVKPEELTLECWISNWPLGVLNSDAASESPNELSAQATTFGAFGTPNAQSNANLLLPQQRAADSLQQLLDLKDNGTPVSVQAGLRTYPNMAIVGLTEHRSAATGKGLSFTLKLKAIRFVTTRQAAQAAIRGADMKKPAVVKATTPAPAAVQAQGLLYQAHAWWSAR